MVIMFQKVLVIIDYKAHKKLQQVKLQRPQSVLSLAPTFDVNHMPIILMLGSPQLMEAVDIMNTGYKGRLDLSHLGYESLVILGEVKAPPRNWRAPDQTDEVSYIVVLDMTRRLSPQIAILSLSVF